MWKEIKYSSSLHSKQIEFYFGDANLQKDRFMKQEIGKHPEGCEYTVFSCLFGIVLKGSYLI